MRSFFFASLLAVSTLSSPAFATSPDAVFNAVAANQFSYASSLARQTSNPLLVRYTDWAALTDDHAGSVGFTRGYQLLRNTRDWPLANRVQLKVEEAALNERPSPEVMEDLCEDFPPISGRGMLACVRAGVADSSQRVQWLKQGWMQGDFAPEEEAMILREYGNQLSADDHHIRVERLLFEGKIAPARHLLSKLSAPHRAIAEARIALINRAPNASALVGRVPAAYQNDAGLTYSRIRWREAKGMRADAASLMLKAPANPPHADLWWGSRERFARQFMAQGRYSDAVQLLSRAGNLNTVNKAEALWLSGWLRYEFLRDARRAYEDFYALYKTVNFPVSKARAAYWAAKAARKNGNPDIANDWLERAAAHPTVFYGQLAHSELSPNDALDLPENPSFDDMDKAGFDREDTIRMIVLLARHGQKTAADMFIKHLAETTRNETRLALLANLGRAIGQPFDAVRVAKIALRKNVIMIEDGWPTLKLPENLAIEPALTLAIVRQESEFDPMARSPANARGLMQLLPATAAETARRIGMAYTIESLWNERFSLTVGSAYLGGRINGWDGSYILAIASYNAGIGNVRKWVAQYGRPGNSVDSAIRWMEQIPFEETRNYVQRVLENLQVYRQLLGADAPPKLQKDLVR